MTRLDGLVNHSYLTHLLIEEDKEYFGSKQTKIFEAILKSLSPEIELYEKTGNDRMKVQNSVLVLIKKGILINYPLIKDNQRENIKNIYFYY